MAGWTLLFPSSYEASPPAELTWSKPGSWSVQNLTKTGKGGVRRSPALKGDKTNHTLGDYCVPFQKSVLTNALCYSTLHP